MRFGRHRAAHRRLATALAHAYNVIEMCAPAAPPIRLPIPNPKP